MDHSSYLIRQAEIGIQRLADYFNPPLRIDPYTMWVQPRLGPPPELPDMSALPPSGMWRLIGYVLNLWG